MPSAGSRSGSESVDSERIVPAIIATPLAVIDEARWNLLQRKIDHSVGADDHGIRSRFKFRDDAAKNAIIDIQVV